MTRALVLEDLLLEVVEMLAAAGIEIRCIKGPAVAHLDYPAPELRSFGDIDLLVRSEHFDDAAQPGASRAVPALPGEVAGLGPALGQGRHPAHQRRHRARRAPHPRDAAGRAAVDLDDLWSRSEEFSVGGRSVTALAASTGC